MSAALDPATRIIVAEALYADGHPSTWVEFCAANEDGLSPADLDDIAASIRSGSTYVGGGGAEGPWWVRLDPAAGRRFTVHELVTAFHTGGIPHESQADALRRVTRTFGTKEERQ